MKRKAYLRRKTKETDISLTLNIDGTGKYKIDTGIGFLDHMLELFSFHGFFDLEVKAKGDLKVDIHHTNEDLGIALAEAFKKALGNKQGIKRFGSAFIPMDETLVQVVLDISGRPNLTLTGYALETARGKKNVIYSLSTAKQFLRAFTNTLGLNLHIQILYGEDTHHIIEAIFKGLAKALDEATQIEKRSRGVPSTKGKI
ncbi:MAG: imidazoleglycerol-phosphate dehydratase HisB [Candidatus Omnitrophica bacterium]|nr:imidazoleglycerol-phosphate dehydratase HisB [Candidatus Omnitrophota bacterium]MCM8798956.1 imidazoleglycerol-phosphate dehydratase HisB [Candidatus Omnitrophota bacterium]